MASNMKFGINLNKAVAVCDTVSTISSTAEVVQQKLEDTNNRLQYQLDILKDHQIKGVATLEEVVKLQISSNDTMIEGLQHCSQMCMKLEKTMKRNSMIWRVLFGIMLSLIFVALAVIIAK